MTNDSVSTTQVLSWRGTLCGCDAMSAPPVPLRAGSLELLFEPQTGWIRQVRTGNRELIRAIYGAVRDENWRTVLPVLRDVSIHQNADEGFTIRFIAECRNGDIQFVWRGTITGNPEGLQFEFQGRAHNRFFRNRIGVCVLYPIAECVGQTCFIEHSDGIIEQGSFPDLIAPHQPFREIRAIRHAATGGRMIEVRFDGDVFEMEDQRNWTDASFKVYSTPLACPFPVQVNEGDLVEQKVTLSFVHQGAPCPAVIEDAENLPAEREACSVRVDFKRLRPKPPIGLGHAGGAAVLQPTAEHLLRALKPDHLRVDCRLWEPDWHVRLTLADEQAQAIGAGLHIAIHLSANTETELLEMARAAGVLLAPVLLWLVFGRNCKCTPAHLVIRARDALMSVSPQAHIAGGTDAYFAELNRERPPASADWLPCCSINPQVHSADTLSLIENLAAQTDVVKSAHSFSSQPLVISPVTLLPRSNPDATRTTLYRNEPPADPRQSSLFAAGWTLGSIAALTAAHPVHSLTFYETVGDRGVLTAGDPAIVFPVYHIFAGIAELTRLAEVRFPSGRSALQVAALAGMSEAGGYMLWLANMTSVAVSVRLETTLDFSAVSMKVIDERNGAEVKRRPEDWWRSAPAGSGLSPDRIVNLPPYGLGRLDMTL